jgi:hypothetical protein
MLDPFLSKTDRIRKTADLLASDESAKKYTVKLNIF